MKMLLLCFCAPGINCVASHHLVLASFSLKLFFTLHVSGTSIVLLSHLINWSSVYKIHLALFSHKLWLVYSLSFLASSAIPTIIVLYCIMFHRCSVLISLQMWRTNLRSQWPGRTESFNPKKMWFWTALRAKTIKRL